MRIWVLSHSHPTTAIACKTEVFRVNGGIASSSSKKTLTDLLAHGKIPVPVVGRMMPTQISLRKVILQSALCACLLSFTPAWMHSAKADGLDPDIIAELLAKTKRRYVVFSANSYSQDHSRDVKFAKNSAFKVKGALEAVGFTPLCPDCYLVGQDATEDNLLAALDAIPERGNYTLLIYYVGHGVPYGDGDDVSLQVYDKPVAPDRGIRIEEIVTALRSQRNFEGKIVLIIDSCFSGNGLKAAKKLSWESMDDTVVLTANTLGQPSLPMDTSFGEMTAFSHYLTRALTDDWDNADSSRDGILVFCQELYMYIKGNLAFRPNPMYPECHDSSNVTLAAYRPDKRESPMSEIQQRVLEAINLKFRPGMIGDQDAETPARVVITNQFGNVHALAVDPEMLRLGGDVSALIYTGGSTCEVEIQNKSGKTLAARTIWDSEIRGPALVKMFSGQVSVETTGRF